MSEKKALKDLFEELRKVEFNTCTIEKAENGLIVVVDVTGMIDYKKTLVFDNTYGDRTWEVMDLCRILFEHHEEPKVAEQAADPKKEVPF